jgi:glycosyltransferase involved in cell wall biosynthesis
VRIALYSSVFPPAIGGVETIARIIAEELSDAHEVTVLTRTPSNEVGAAPFKIERQPSWLTLMRVIRAADVTLHMNVSLKVIWANLLLRRPTIVVHHGWYGSGSRKRLRDRLKDFTTRLVTNIAVSRAVAERIPAPCRVIPNCYDERVFRCVDGTHREGLAFVGRLVSEKRVRTAIEALSILRRDGVNTTLTVIGDGPDRMELEQLAEQLQIAGSVRFVGSQSQESVARLLNERDVVLVPSSWEGFGLVALEAFACGCFVVGSGGGGLAEAIGDCGLIAPGDDPQAFAIAVKRILTDEDLRQRLRAGREEHLANHSRAMLRRRYLEALDAKRAGA